MSDFHPLLKRQLSKANIDLAKCSAEVMALFEMISRSYQDVDAERYTIQRSFEISSKEMDLLRAHLEDERAYLKSIMNEALLTINASWEVSTINKESERLLGIDQGDLPVFFGDLFQLYEQPNEDTLIPSEGIINVLSAGKALSQERAYTKSKHGDFKPIAFSLNPLPQRNQEGFAGAIVVLRDVTEHLEFECALKEALTEATRLNEAKNLFLANMSHEIRTPLNGVIGVLQLLGRTQLSDNQADHLRMAREAADRLLEIIDDVLDFSKLDSGMATFEKTAFNLHKELTSIHGLLLPQFKSKHIQLDLLIDSDVPTSIESDPQRLRQILIKLASNALKFTSGGEVSIHVSLSRQSVNQLEVRVKDSGVGIAPEALGSLFESFHQADQSTTRAVEGTGLGLSIIKQVVEKMGGTIQVTSTPNEGSEFYFTFPFMPVGEAPTQLSDQKPSVLVVDDNELNLKVTSEMLQMLGCNVELAHNGQLALEKLNQGNFQVVFMDCHMPVMDGYEATRKIRQQEHEAGISKYGPGYTVVIALTANAFQNGKDKCFASGMDDYLSKPFQMDDLQNLLNTHLSARKKLA